MDGFQLPDLQGLEYISRQEAPAPYRLFSWLGLGWLIPPVKYTVPQPERPFPSLKELLISLGFKEEAGILSQDAQRESSRKLARLYSRTLVLIYVLLALIWFFPTVAFAVKSSSVLFYANEIRQGASLADWLPVIIEIFLALIVFFMGTFITTTYAVRVAFAIVNRRQANLICVGAVVYLLLELSREDALLVPEYKQSLQRRLRELVRSTYLLLPQFASQDRHNQQWMRDHINKMALYILKREQWIIAPTTTTLADLRRDFSQLVPVYVYGHYGEFPVHDIQLEQVDEQPSGAKRVFSAVGRIAAISIPVLVLGFIWAAPARFAESNINTNMLVLFMLGWLLVAIDTILRIGLVDRILSVAKSIRDLK